MRAQEPEEAKRIFEKVKILELQCNCNLEDCCPKECSLDSTLCECTWDPETPRINYNHFYRLGVAYQTSGQYEKAAHFF